MFDSHMSEAERAAYPVAADIAQRLRRLGVQAEHGPSWNAVGGSRWAGEAAWYVFSRPCGGVTVSCDAHGDTIFCDPVDLVGIVERLRLEPAPPVDPEVRRARVWAIFAPHAMLENNS